jgi:CRP-like cAMP-binding protein
MHCCTYHILFSFAIYGNLLVHTLFLQIAMADTYLYRAGDPGECIFFVSHGSMRVELNADLNLLDSRGITALQILLHKHTVYSDVHIAGDHFGEYCVVSHAGLRPESVKVLSGSEVYALSRADLWSIFQYLTYAERRAMIYELMTRVGERHHITKKMNPVYTVDNDLGEDTRMKALYRMAFDVMNELIDELNSIELLRSQDHDDEHHLSLKRMLRAQSANADKFSQRDLIDLFERETNANQNIRLTFSENALRSRLSSFNSHIEPIDPTESVGFESGSDRSASPRTRASSFAAVATGSNAAALRSPSISHLVMTKIPNMTGVESSQDLEVRDIESDPTSEEEDSVEGGDGFNQASHGESRRRSPSNSFVHKRVQALAAGAEKEKEKEVELRTVSPVAAVRKGSGVRFDLELEVPAAPAATPVGGAKSVILHRRSSNVDYNVVKNALEIEEMVGHRRGSTSIRGGAYMDSPL